MNSAHVTRNIIEHTENGMKVIPVPTVNTIVNHTWITALISALGFTEKGNVSSAIIGPTGYLEVDGTEPEGYGVDKVGRAFVQFRVEKRTEASDWKPGFIRIFQRYVGGDVLVSCETGVSDFIPSQLTKPQFESLINAITYQAEVCSTTKEAVYWFEKEGGLSAEEAYKKDPWLWNQCAVYLRRKK